MPAARPLRDVFTELTGEGEIGLGADRRPDELLRAEGHEDLGDDLVAEAVVNFADVAPVEVAEHLARFVMAHTPVPLIDPAPAGEELPGWLDLLAGAPAATGIAEIGDDGPAGLDGLDGGDAAIGSADDGFDIDIDHSLFLDFGHGDAEPGGAPIDGDAEIGRATGPDIDEFDDGRDHGLTVYDGHLADLGEHGASIGHAQVDDGDDTSGDDTSGDDPADTLDV